MSKGQVKVSDYIAQRLAEFGINTAFLVQGAANNDLIYSIADRKDIRYVCPMHEQAAGFMAEGWAKVTGKPGLAIGTSGPGGQNLLTPICNFFYDSVPGIFITGQVNSQFMRKSRSIRQVGFQEWPASEVFKPVTKMSATIHDPKAVPEALDMALWACEEGRPGPVVLDIPLDIQRAKIDPFECTRFDGEVPWYSSDVHAKCRQLVAEMSSAKRPVIIVGGGVNIHETGTMNALDTLAEALGVPLFPTWNALDVVPSNHAFYGGRIGTYGGAGRNFAVQNADLVLALGCRLSGRITGGNVESFARGAKRWVVDIDTAMLKPENQQLPFHENIRCDVGTFMAILEGVMRAEFVEGRIRQPDHREWLKQAQFWRDKYDPLEGIKDIRPQVHPYVFADVLSAVLPDDAVIVYDCGGNAVVMNHAFRTKKGQRYFSNNGNSPMGFSFCAALGAALAAPSRQVVCIIGDGGMNLNIQELQTLRNYGIKVTVFILNNHVYGITKAFQEAHFGQRFEASGPVGYRPPNFRRVVDAYGVDFASIDHCSEMWKVKEILKADHAMVVDVVSDEFRTYEPKIAGWATPIEDMSPLLPREEFRANMIVEPLPGWENANYGPYETPKA